MHVHVCVAVLCLLQWIGKLRYMRCVTGGAQVQSLTPPPPPSKGPYALYTYA